MGAANATPARFPDPRFSSVGSYLTIASFTAAQITVVDDGVDKGVIDPGDHFVMQRDGNNTPLSWRDALSRLWDQRRAEKSFKKYQSREEFMEDVARYFGGVALRKWEEMMRPFRRPDADAQKMSDAAQNLLPRFQATCDVAKELVPHDPAQAPFRNFICSKASLIYQFEGLNKGQE